MLESLNLHLLENLAESLETPPSFDLTKEISAYDPIEVENDDRGIGNEEIYLESLNVDSEEDELEEARKT